MKFELIGSRNLHNKIKGNASRQRAVHLVTYNYYNYCFYRTSAAALPGWWYCYSPVNKLPPRLATSRPLGKRSEPFLAAKRPTASDKVARSWLVSLERVCICTSRQKWGVAWLAFGVSGFICESLTSMAECADSTPTKSIERVCVSPSSKEQICLLRAKVDDLRQPEKNKNLFQSRVNIGKRDYTTTESLTSAHILNLTCISLPVTLTGSENVS